MREVPRRERVGREALVHHRQRRDHRLVGEVEVVRADLVREQHALVDERARRHRRHVELLAVARRERLDRVPRALADDVELALERVLVDVAAAAADEDLADDAARLPWCARTGRALFGRHVAPAEQHLALGDDRALDLLLARHARCRLARQEHHARRRIGRPPGSVMPSLPHARRRKASGSWIRMPAPSPCSGSAPVAPRCDRLLRIVEALPDDGVILATLDVGDEAQPASVVLVGRVV